MEPALVRDCPARPESARGQLAALGAVVALTAATTTTAVLVVPELLAAIGHAGGGAHALFLVAHVLGQVVGAIAIGRRLAGEVRARRLVVGGLVASAGILAATAGVAGGAPAGAFELLIGLRFADGLAHVAAVMGLLVAAGAGVGDDDAGLVAAERRLRLLGGVLVIGVAIGLGASGRFVGAPFAAPFATAAALAVIAAVVGALVVPVAVARAARSGPARAPRATVLAIAAVRFSFGVVSLALPRAAVDVVDKRWVGASMGTMMLLSVLALPAVAWAARRAGWGVVGRGGAFVLAAALAAVALPGMVTSPTGLAWAAAAGSGAAAVYAAALAAVAAIADPAARMRAAGAVHASGSAGHALGIVLAGVVVGALVPLDAAAVLGAGAVGLGGVVLAVRGRA